jgi:crossover junction endodeoxyribonuclease RuvC
MKKTFVGIDPGLSGAIAVYNRGAGKILAVYDMPTVTVGRTKKIRQVNEMELAKIISIADPQEAIIEEVHAMPQQGVSSTFRLGDAFGVIKGVLAGLGIPFKTVHPQTWKKAYGLGWNKGDSRQLASRTWPDMASFYSRVKDDGRAEASLLAEFLAHNSRSGGQ